VNPTTWTIYREYLDRTNGDATAASALTLADALQRTLDAKEIVSPEPDLPTGLLDVKTAARQLNLSSKKVYQMCISGEIRCFRTGRSIRITLEEIERFEADNKPPSTDLTPQ
jgi:excisionase family DNA binding protein